ncbi:MAG: ATP-binding protein [Candidatus Stygibacter frigidus]|nr:ATP-binding protein [Candidatus Stygibacter frigidus]
MYIKRQIQELFEDADHYYPIVMVTGARQVGKTTFLQTMRSGNRGYVTLDDPRERETAQSDPALFLQRHPAPLIIDEIQYAPELFPYLKMRVDVNKQPGQYWLTGSQQFHLMKNVTESLAGRVALIELMGFTEAEIQESASKSKLFSTQLAEINLRESTPTKNPLEYIYKRIIRGSMPEMSINPGLSPDLFFNSYIQTYLKRDVKALTQVGNETVFFKFLRSVAARSAQILNKADIAKDIGISPKTVDSWLSILITSGIVYLLEPFFTNINKRLIKSPKIYMLDTGLCSHLCGWSDWKTLEKGAQNGALLENWIIIELLKNYKYNGSSAQFYYLRTRDKSEIDLIIAQNGLLYPLEIKKSANPTKNDIRNFITLRNLGKKIGNGGVISFSEKVYAIDDMNSAIPVTKL